MGQQSVKEKEISTEERVDQQGSGARKHRPRKSYHKQRQRSSVPHKQTSQRTYKSQDTKAIEAAKKPDVQHEQPSTSTPQKTPEKQADFHKERPEYPRHRREQSKPHEEGSRQKREERAHKIEQKQSKPAPVDLPKQEKAEGIKHAYKQIETTEQMSEKSQEQAPIIIRPGIKKSPVTTEPEDETKK